ncbi:aminotransferase class I/II-fold pyridoxal phosphate-dependent enzyme [Halomonas lysinitropha]|uniref:Aminotransferase n=1 Tax=Halomonas lysinitropha TaxID=2607506 RepID=A0A5K1I8Q4_9GAMM|nr:aminotransferase class I/II-fold pyridoxal phosphate-dependent enzyme [Halomonas lysinitropha]VVZ96881.1 Aspartate aminotransferase [Halomonas lysinitropha]
MTLLSQRSRNASAEFALVEDFFLRSSSGEARNAEEACDFSFGNPHEMPLAGLVEALARNLQPQNPQWFAYKISEPEPRAFIAKALSSELGLDFEPEDIALTHGAFAAIALAFCLVLDAGDEVIIPVPGWFCYASMLRAADLVPVKVGLSEPDFDLDLEAIDAAITPRTRMVVVNSPHNPTGRVYSQEQLQALADLLDSASNRIGARIWLLSDEPYRRIRFNHTPFVSPAALYPWTLIDYSYGKVLLAPGQRLGYLAISPRLPAEQRAELQGATFSVQMSMGWTFPSALMQYSVASLENVSIDLDALATKRDLMLHSLEQWGYQMVHPEGTFYLWGEAPGGDALRFIETLAARSVFVLPGTLFERRRHFRISLTANIEMIERALPIFRDAIG